MKKDLTLRRIKNTNFPELYKKFILNENGEAIHKTILSLAIIFINSQNPFVQRLGYRMVVLFCNRTKQYEPLYEIAINMGLYPISKFISQKKDVLIEDVFYELNEAFLENYIQEEKYQSFAQKNLSVFFENNLESTLAVIAPTSYGKTELILSMLKSCVGKNFCIITPTKSLLAQTKMRIVAANIEGVKKIVTHPEMHNESDTSIIAVLTQERLLRLLRKSKTLSFDYVIVDEAHGLLSKENREILLASVIILLEKRNSKTIFKFLTPFLNEAKNLKVRNTQYESQSFSVDEYIKTERFYFYDIKKGKLSFYDQFMDDFYVISDAESSDEISFVESHRADKNIVYLNKPIDIEEYAGRLSVLRDSIRSESIERACAAIAEYIHPQYNLIQYLKKGIIYHHGSVPESIRLYIEHLYSVACEINYVITSSTLLEGVNLPGERMFILDNKKGRRLLSSPNFKNLIGRICRFGDIFNTGNPDMKKLEPEIYLINSKYCSLDANIQAFLSKVAKVDKSIEDAPENILLEATPIDESNQDEYVSAIEFIENYENQTIASYENRYVQTEVGKICFLNNISEVSIFKVEDAMQKRIESFRKNDIKIREPDALMNIINEVFLAHLPEGQDLAHQTILRLQHEAARKFYSMFLSWRITGASYSQMIASFLAHWDKLIEEKRDTLVFVGRWGDETRGGHQRYWTDIKSKSRSQKINLAIVRIKEEQDFLDNVIIKFIEVIYDLEFLEEPFYNKIKYGTDDRRKITLVKNGFSLSLANRLVDNYLDFLIIDTDENTVALKKELRSDMEKNNENQVLINEVLYFLG